jgi:dihydrofolate reductase
MASLRCSVFIALSLDGFIARKDGGLDWLPKPVEGEDFGYTRFIETVDTVLMGRNTFEQVLTFPEYPYPGLRMVVLSSRPLTLLPHLPGQIQIMRGDPVEIVRILEQQGTRHAYVDGGETIRRFLQAGLIQDLILTHVPILLGEGIPLFGGLSRDVPLEHVDTRVYPDGLVQSHYRVLSQR